MDLASDRASMLQAPFKIRSEQQFNAWALRLFRLHATENPIYREFLKELRIRPSDITNVADIPCLPVTLFKRHRVNLIGVPEGVTFSSSGTTDTTPSRHHMPWPELYEKAFLTGFEEAHGPLTERRILALLPSYLERGDSSLVYMMDRSIKATGDPLSGTYMNDTRTLLDLLQRPDPEGRSTMLFGVTFALLDLAERGHMDLSHVTIVETGGMKGRREELVREEVHARLKKAFNVELVHSEYGMTELSSQAWSKGEGKFYCPPWMRVLPRDPHDPLSRASIGRNCGLDVIDLCNAGSCPFISTQDLGRVHSDGSFEVLGRFDNSDLRGCNLMVAG